MLILNTQLDVTIALERYGEVTGNRRYANHVISARNATRTVLGLRSADWLYRILFRAINLTLLPTVRAAALPFHLRAIKRFAREYLIPNLYHIKTRYPRLVMPGGYIDRALALKGWAFHYLTINIMDLIRYQRRFPDEDFLDTITSALEFTHDSGIIDRWKELPYEKYALGFWVEALYQMCLISEEGRYRDWLVEAVLVLEDMGMGVSPSLLGCNGDAIRVERQKPCPVANDTRLRVVNLGRKDFTETLVINSGDKDVDCRLIWKEPGYDQLVWRQNGTGSPCTGAISVPSRGWIHGKDACEQSAETLTAAAGIRK